MKIDAIFFDQDGVLADFTRAALRAHGKTLPIMEAKWDFPSQVGFTGASDPEFWKPLGFDFWASLPVHADGLALFRRLACHHPKDRFAVLSSPCETAGCVDGKRAWIAEHVPELAKRAFFGSAKEMFAGPAKLLIDDRDENVERFRAAGGHAVLVPRPWNKRKSDCFLDGGFCPVDLEAEIVRILK